MAQVYTYAFSTMVIVGPFIPAPDPGPGQERRPEMAGIERIEWIDGSGRNTGHVVYTCHSPLGDIGVVEGETVATDEHGGVHILIKHPEGGLMDKANNAGPYNPLPPAQAQEVADAAALREQLKQAQGRIADLSQQLQNADQQNADTRARLEAASKLLN